jgi:hypothetical protein
VTVTFDLGGLAGDELVSKFIFDGSIDPTSFTIASSSGAVAESISTIFDSTSDRKADGTGGHPDARLEVRRRTDLSSSRVRPRCT